jgi:hypothetical protein
MKRRQPTVLFAMLTTPIAAATLLLSTTSAQAGSCLNENEGMGPGNDPLAENYTGPGGQCFSLDYKVTCPSGGQLGFEHLGATCIPGDSAQFSYTLTDTYAETALINGSVTGQANYFWLYVDQGGYASLACGNSLGYDPYSPNHKYTWCLGSGGYSVTIDNTAGSDVANVEDWVTNMEDNPPDGE